MAKKVLIIDSNELEAKNASSILEQNNYNCVHTNSSDEILSFIYSQIPDLIILEAVMPEVSGYEICRLLKEDAITKEIPVIIYTKLSKNIDKFWAYKAGADGYIVKSEDSYELINNVNSLIEAMPVSFELKSELAKVQRTDSAGFDSAYEKIALIEALEQLKEIDCEDELLAIRIFRTIYEFFKYDAIMLSFVDHEEENNTLLFGVSNLNISNEAYEEVKNTVNRKEPHRIKIKEVLSQEKSIDIQSFNDFMVKYEFEQAFNLKTIGWFSIYVKQNTSNSELKLLSTIKNQVYGIIKHRYLKNLAQQKDQKKNVRRLYSKVDFDKLISYELDWHRRNALPLGLAYIEIDFLEAPKESEQEDYDLLLAKISNILNTVLSDGDLVYRNEDDVFLVLMTSTYKNKVQERLLKIKEEISKEVESMSKEVKIDIGAIMHKEEYRNHYEYIDSLYELLYEHKENQEEIMLR